LRRGIFGNAGRTGNALPFAAGSFREIDRSRRHFSTIVSFVLDSSEEVRCLTPCSPGARCASAEIIKLDPRAPVQQLLGTVVWQAVFGLGILARCSIGGLFSPLSFYVEARFTSSPLDSPQRISLDTPPSSLLVSAFHLPASAAKFGDR
jgi:hypothetical protein